MSAETVVIPRNFVLLEELEKAEKGATDMAISYGLIMADDISLSDWQCTIIGPQNSAVDNRVINLVVRCGPKYPVEAPEALFQTKVNYPFVDAKGRVDVKRVIKTWTRQHRMENLLVEIRKLFVYGDYRKLPQPPEGLSYDA
mmetsp:Transcript_36101/g.115922  ORF Transcript_36101/g.115922 Transcript_36101/m.115922 type:complete len:142 (-) Transcript_36101:656-1081(-)